MTYKEPRMKFDPALRKYVVDLPTKNSGEGKVTKEEDDFGQLSKIRLGNNASAPLLEEYFYDESGTRVAVLKYNSTGYNYETIITPSREFTRITNDSGNYDYTYVYQGNTLVSRKNPDGSKWYYMPDHLGSTTLILDESGNIVEKTFYSPFGDIDGSNPTEETKVGYTGHELDEDTGQTYMGARYLDTDTGLFITGDPVIQNPFDPQYLNHYSYVRNNPYANIDPDGRVSVGFQGAQSSGSHGDFLGDITDRINERIDNRVYRSNEPEVVEAAVNYVKESLATEPNQPVIIYGHSRGGQRALELQQRLEEEGITVDAVITIDPVYEFFTGFNEGELDPMTNFNFFQRNNRPFGRTYEGITNEPINAGHTGIDSNVIVTGFISDLVNSAHTARNPGRFTPSGKKYIRLGRGGSSGSFRCRASSCSVYLGTKKERDANTGKSKRGGSSGKKQ
jgi:RHS repeat-associated protein